MEISPIAGVSYLPVQRTEPADPDLRLFDIEATARAGDEEGSFYGRKAAGAEEADDEAAEGEQAVSSEPEPGQDTLPRKISFFA